MNLTTHWVLAFALGIALTHRTETALIMSIGALIPDLDREYLFVARDFIGRHQLHRALFHNVFIIGGIYLLNPFLALGALSHAILDAFTSATDRGVELLFPLTRLVRGHYYDIDGQQSQEHKRITWWVEDTWRLLKTTSDRDLQEPDDQPWRRLYGPFRNSRVVDWGIFFTCLAYLILVYVVFGASYYSMEGFRLLSLVSIVGIGIFYGIGEWYRRRVVLRLRAMRTAVNLEPLKTNWFVLGVLIVGVVVFVYSAFAGGVFLLSPPLFPDVETLLICMSSLFVGLGLAWFLVRVLHTDDAV